MSELLHRPSLLGATLPSAQRLGRAVEHPPFRSDRLFGYRAIKRPLIAIATKKELGNCRHALSQMVVAGVMTVYPPIKPGAKPAEAPQLGPRVLTFTPPPPKDVAPEPTPAPPPPPRPAPAARPAITASVPQRRPPPGPANKPTAPAPDRLGRTVSIERRVVEDFNTLPREDEE